MEVAKALGGSFKLVTPAPKPVREMTQLPQEIEKSEWSHYVLNFKITKNIIIVRWFCASNTVHFHLESCLHQLQLAFMDILIKHIKWRMKMVATCALTTFMQK